MEYKFKKTSVFVSYSHNAHAESGLKVNATNRMNKVENFCNSLEKYNIDVKWDRDIKLGFDQNRFMTQLENSDYVIILLTKDYQDKIINNRPGGVSFEYKLIKDKYTKEKKIDTNIIPILFDGFTPDDLEEETLKNLNYRELKDARTNLYNETIIEIVKNILPEKRSEHTIVLNGDYSIENKADTILFFEHYFVSKPLFQPNIYFDMPGRDEVIADYENIVRDIYDKNDATKSDIKDLRECMITINEVDHILGVLTKAINMFISLFHKGQFNYDCIDYFFIERFIDAIVKINSHNVNGNGVMCAIKDDINKRFYFYPDDEKWYKDKFLEADFNGNVVDIPTYKIAYDILPAFFNYVINPDVPSRALEDFVIYES